MKIRFINILKIFLGFGLLIVIVIYFFGYQDIPIDQLKKKYTDSHSSFVKVGGMEVHYRDQGKQIHSLPSFSFRADTFKNPATLAPNFKSPSRPCGMHFN